jgi:hypothetical protein
LEAGVTRSGDHFVGLAAMKMRDPATGINVEVFTASAQVGAQNELQGGLARVGFDTGGDGVRLSGTMEVMTARANLGTHNDDGTVGANAGLGATAVGGELTVAYGPWSLTGGAAASLGWAFSSGESDVDNDGALERCFKGSVGVATLGVCTEFK